MQQLNVSMENLEFHIMNIFIYAHQQYTLFCYALTHWHIVGHVFFLAIWMVGEKKHLTSFTISEFEKSY